METQPQARYPSSQDVDKNDSLETLSSLPAGRSGIVSRLEGGKEFIARIASLGFNVGAQITVVQNYRHGPMIVLLHGSHLAVGQGEAQKIRVRLL
jgi:ferrous iron transport protein A